MENRERDRMSQRNSPTEAGELNRKTEEQRGNSGTGGAEFGKNIGSSEHLSEKGGNTDMRNRDQENMNPDRSSSEETRRPSGDSGFGSSSGRSSSSGSLGNSRGSSDISSDRDVNESDSDRSRRGSMGNSDSGKSSSGEH